jgi:DNA polymerase elongation subunit (family B)
MHERAKILGLELYFLSGLSRLKNIQSVIKKEFFSSNAYGDSEMFRLYIPGRLNYDLLIHFKRGMKNYASYKLDNIAEVILGEKKNPVSVKQIFSFYKEGNPDRIREVGEYCIQDTVLLQKLVDKQLILSSITQLANVTYVPISFLLTRGQTVKVLSQIYRKSRQMGYLVPHTNFNSDTFSSTIILSGNGSSGFTEGDFIKVNCGIKKSSGVIDKIVSNNTLEVSTNSEIELNGVCNMLHSGRTFKIVSVDDTSVEESFSGATVLTAIPGIFQDNVAILDFASLYPTIMISRNLCFSTFVMDPKYLDIPGVKYETIEWDDKIFVKIHQTCDAVMATGAKKGSVCGKQAFFNVAFKHYCRVHDPLKKTREEAEKFQKKDVHYKYTIVQPGANDENKGVVPALLEELYSTRKLVKKQMAEAYKNGNKELVNILNSNQMAIKVSLNSTYGFLGRGKGNLILKELGSIVTSVGRMLIEQSKEYTEGAFLDYVKESGILTHKISPNGHLESMTESAKDIILVESIS